MSNEVLRQHIQASVDRFEVVMGAMENHMTQLVKQGYVLCRCGEEWDGLESQAMHQAYAVSDAFDAATESPCPVCGGSQAGAWHQTAGDCATNTPVMAPTPPDEWELRARLMAQAMWDARGILGFDQDGDKEPHFSDWDEYARNHVRDAQEMRDDYDSALDEVSR